jgi:hypothetical protein
MDGFRKYAVSVAFLASFFAVGIPYWMISYGTIYLPNALYGPGLYVVGAAAFLLCVFRVAKVGRVAVIIGASVPAAVFARVVVEGVMDPTSHNLWPLEIIIALIAGLICSSAGSITGTLVAVLLPAQQEAEKS